MIHNGIEYGMMAAYGEGFDILKASPYGKDLDFAQVAHLCKAAAVHLPVVELRGSDDAAALLAVLS